MNRLIQLTLFLLVVMLPVTAKAYDFEVNGIYYNKSGTNATVTYQSYSNGTYTSDYSGSVTIPETVTYNGTTYSVTSIGNYAFRDCSGLTSVTIPNSVTTIGFYAFYGCSGLTSVTIPNSVTTIGFYAFRNCSGLTSVNIFSIEAWLNISFVDYYANPLGYAHHLFLNGVEVKELVIPNSVTSIGNSAFYGCSGLTSVTIPNSVTSIGYYAFEGCSGLTSVTIPNSVTSIGFYAFEGCSGLTSVTIPNSVTTIGYHAFEGCSGLTSVTIPNSVTSIGDYAFRDCSGLTSVTIPNSVTTIGDYAFYYCTGLTNIDIPNSVISIGNYAFEDCSGLTSVTIGNSVTSIGNSAFEGCSGLTSVTIGNSVTSIRNSAFEGCSGLTSVNIFSIEAWLNISFGDYCANPLMYAHHLFLNGVEVKELVIPNSVTSIRNYAFRGCSGLTSVTIPNSVTSIGDDAFPGCSGLTSVTIPNSVISIGNYAFKNCSGLTSVTIGNSVTSIGDDAFYYCSKLKTVIWNAINCTSIGNAYNYSLTSLLFGDSVEHIPTGMPRLSMSDKVLVLPQSIKTIETGAFKGSCGAVVIGDSIENIAAGSFPSGISVAYVSTMNPRPCEAGAFANPQTLYVPAGSRMSYFTSQGWSEFANIIEGAYVCATDITLNPPTTVMSKGKTQQLTATISPSNASSTTVSWLSLDPDVATVSSSGQITAVAVGETDIVAMVDNVRDTCHVNVVPTMVESLTLSDTQLSLQLNDICTLMATVLPTNAENQALEWIIPDNDVIVAQVVNNTKLNIGAVGIGTVPITVRTTDGSNLSATCTVSVQVICTSIALNMTSAEMSEGGVLQLIATVLPSNATNRTVTWSSSNTSVVTVSSDGLVTAVSPGNATITATTTDGSNLSATCSLFVKQNIIYVTSISLDNTSATITEGEELQLMATVLPEDATNKTVTWSSSNTSVATVSSEGLVTAESPGSAIITATTADGTNLSATCTVTVIGNQIDYDNYLSMSDTVAFHGETIVIPVSMTNAEQILSFQTDIFLPEGLEIVQEDGDYLIDPSSRMTRTHSIMSNDVSNGAIRVICYSSNYKPFTGNSGDDLFYLTVKVADDAEGDYTIQLKNTLLTNTDFEEIVAPDVAANVNVKAYLLGDANNSGTVSITDVVVTAQYVLELNPQPFVFEAADANVDGNITVADVSRIAWMVLNPTLNAPLRAPALWNNGDRMSAEDITLASGETRRVSILLDNEMGYNAFQLDINLPEGLTASNFQVTDRAAGHTFDVNTLLNGNIRALCYSPALTVINGHEGALLTFDVTAAGDVNGDILVDGIELVTADCQSVKLDAFTIGINKASRVNELATDKTIAKVEYFNLAGQRIELPSTGVTLIVTTYTDGTQTTSKVIK